MASYSRQDRVTAEGWSQPHFNSALQLEEECTYLLQSQPASRDMIPQYLPLSIPDLNTTLWDAASSTFGSSPAQTQSSPTFSRGSPATDQSPYRPQYPADFNSSNLPHGNASMHPPVTVNESTPTYMPPGPMQFPLSQPLPHRQSDLRARLFGAKGTTQPSKRPRPADDDDDGADSSNEHENSAKQKPNSACSRCRGLKVRCEFVGDNDVTCKRCAQANMECVIPDRKPRRRPPKREVLLKQIREQASQIVELMAKLERSNQSAGNSQAVVSPSQSQSPPATAIDTNAVDVVPKQEVQDWISKARESLRTFGGLIPAPSPTIIHRGNGHASTDGEDDEDFPNDSEYDTAEDDWPKDGGSPAHSIKKKDVSAPQLIPNEEAPYGLMARMSIKAGARQKSAEPESSDAVGVANADFFRPSPGPDPIRTSELSHNVRLPHILARGIITVHDADAFFDTYFQKMNPSVSLLDRYLHTPQYVAMHSPFLFTVVCATASRFDTKRPELYGQLMQYAQLAAGTALISGPKNEEMCAAYMIMQLYPVPSKHWEEDRGWIYLGVAIRIAQDIHLNRPVTTKPLNEHHARRLLSRTRIWLNCFNLDRSTGTQYGKRAIIPNSDYVARHCDMWWQSSPYNLRGFDVQTCIYNMELRLMADFMAKIYSDPTHPMGLNKSANFTQIASETDDKLRHFGEEWFPLLDEFDRESSESWFRSQLLKMAFAYQRLVALSAGLRYAKEEEIGENSFLLRCLEAASDVVNAFVRRLFVTSEQKVYLRHAPEGQFVFVTFAGAFLIKLLQPKWLFDERHAPMLYSRFLAGLLTNMAVDAPSGAGDGNSVNTSTSGATLTKRPSTKARGKGTGAMGSSPNLSFGLASSSSPGYTSSVGPVPSSATTTTSGPTTSPGSSRFSESPSPSSQSPSSALRNTAHQQQLYPYQNTALTSMLFEGSQNPGGEGGISSSDFFQSPMPIDAEMLQSMQFVTNPEWQVPGFNWMMNQYDSNGYSANDYALFESQQF
ncbi:hypothetical protein F5J12DRAFT_857405 [Pisolithus orientalis]|uniref:uncharacterized protein n=1 Tax=Pisolithus orientalis TaxID=936130 RepID=UPI002224DCE7|nr:uncharacterized protein F5J12DRAFT_857405 [Pisolithus orientalis]KAI5994267.1 hypothetical protein F5J12DRAFT_857405 [Pisolithus orientalis]